MRSSLGVMLGTLVLVFCMGCGDDDDKGGACQQDGERCGGEHGTCCTDLICCSGVPVPQGQEYCATNCPISDRNAKYNIKPISDPDKVLRGVVALPISTWTYKNEPRSIKHIGPMAQDFKATFRVGSSERHISPVDADGVALAAIQSLNRQLRATRRELKTLRSKVRALETRCSKIPSPR